MNKTDFLRALPEPLRADPQTAALAQVVAQALDQCTQEIETALIYSRIENLPEELLDILAYDFKIDWYDSQYTLEEKRRTVRDSWRVRRFLGTKYAVQTALSAIYPGAEVLEWFQYDGEPYHFRVSIKILDVEYEPVKHKRVLERIQWYKNLRSWLDRIHYELPPVIFIEQPGKLVFQNFHVKIFANYWNCYSFNGVRHFDGSIDFDFRRGGLNFVHTYIRTTAKLQYGLSPSQLKMNSLCIINPERIPLNIYMGRTVFDNMGEFIRFNGDRKLDASWLLWQRARTAIFQNFHIRTTALEEPSLFFPVYSKMRITHRNPNVFKQPYLKTGIFKFAPTTENSISRIRIKHLQCENNQVPLLWNTVFSAFCLKNKEKISSFQIWHINFAEGQSFFLRQFDFMTCCRESTGSGILHLSAGIFLTKDIWKKIYSGIKLYSSTRKQSSIFSCIRINIYTKVPRLMSKTKMQKIYFAPYSFHNYNEMGNACLTVIESSQANGKDCFDGSLIFNGKSIPKTIII